MRLFVLFVFLSAQHSVSFASSFLHAPTDKTANLGERVVLPCIVQDDFCLHEANVSWFFSDNPIISSSAKYTRYSGRELHIASMSASDEGTYYCKVETRYGTIRSPDARLKVQKLLGTDITSERKTPFSEGTSFRLRRNDAVVVTWTAVAVAKRENIHWVDECLERSQKRTICMESSDCYVTYSVEEIAPFKIRIVAIFVYDSFYGILPCNSLDLYLMINGAVSDTVKVHALSTRMTKLYATRRSHRRLSVCWKVSAKAHRLTPILVSPEDTTVEEGRLVTLFCFAVGAPLRAEWSKDGASISDGGRFNVLNGMLQINSTILQDSGMYNCSGRALAKLIVYKKLSVDVSELVYFSPSDSITGNCSSEGNGTLSLLIDGKFQQNTSNNLLQFELPVDQMASYFVLQCMVTSFDIVNGNTEKTLGVTRHENAIKYSKEIPLWASVDSWNICAENWTTVWTNSPTLFPSSSSGTEPYDSTEPYNRTEPYNKTGGIKSGALAAIIVTILVLLLVVVLLLVYFFVVRKERFKFGVDCASTKCFKFGRSSKTRADGGAGAGAGHRMRSVSQTSTYSKELRLPRSSLGRPLGKDDIIVYAEETNALALSENRSYEDPNAIRPYEEIKDDGEKPVLHYASLNCATGQTSFTSESDKRLAAVKKPSSPTGAKPPNALKKPSLPIGPKPRSRTFDGTTSRVTNPSSSAEMKTPPETPRPYRMSLSETKRHLIVNGQQYALLQTGVKNSDGGEKREEKSENLDEYENRALWTAGEANSDDNKPQADAYENNASWMTKENDGKAAEEEDEEQDYVNHRRPPPPPLPQPSSPPGSEEEKEEDDDDYVPYRRPPPPPPPPPTPADKSYPTEGLYENQGTVGRGEGDVAESNPVSLYVNRSDPDGSPDTNAKGRVNLDYIEFDVLPEAKSRHA